MDQPAKKCQNASNFDDEKRMVWGSLKNCYRLNKMAQSELKLEKNSTSRKKKVDSNQRVKIKKRILS